MAHNSNKCASGGMQHTGKLKSNDKDGNQQKEAGNIEIGNFQFIGSYYENDRRLTNSDDPASLIQPPTTATAKFHEWHLAFNHVPPEAIKNALA